MSTRHRARASLCAAALALAACDEPNEPNAIGPDDFEQTASDQAEPPPTADDTDARGSDDE